MTKSAFAMDNIHNLLIFGTLVILD